MPLFLIFLTTFVVMDFAKPATIDAPPKAYIDAAKATKHPDLLLAMAFVESGYRLDAIGALGELGPLQLRPEFFPTIRNCRTVACHFQIADKHLIKLEKSCAFLKDAYFVCYNMGVTKAKFVYANLVLDTARLNDYHKKVTEAKSAIRKWTNVQVQSKVRDTSDGKKVCRLPKNGRRPRCISK